jgi:phosphate-selective porin OprO and OprP
MQLPLPNSWLRRHATTILAAALATVPLTSLRAADADEIKLLREQIRALEQKLNALEQKQERRDAEAAATAKTEPRVSVSDKGFSLASADGANAIRLRGLLWFDSRLFFHDGGLVNNSFVLRRARIISEGTLSKIFEFQVVPEFVNSSVGIVDANVNVALSKAVQIKFGRFKPPVGLEMLQSDTVSLFTDRAMATSLVPNRDLGVQVGGALVDGTVNYAIGVFNGVADGATTSNADYDNDKDVAARLFVQPFKNSADSPLQGLGFGVGGESGRQKTASALTAGYKTDGQQTFFRYRTTAVADGPIWRVSPQAYYYNGAFGALAEYNVSAVNVRSSAASPATELRNKAWQASASWVLTGEKASYLGVAPDHPLSLDNGTWGAWEVAVRYADLKIDSNAFPLFADPAVSASQAAAWGVGVNWYATRTFRATLDYFRTRFSTAQPPTATLLRQDEQALITRLQLSF